MDQSPEQPGKPFTDAIPRSRALVAILVWPLILPFGWLSGWSLGVAYGIANPQVFTWFPLDNKYAYMIGASDGGLIGGAAGVTIGLLLAVLVTWITLRGCLPKLERSFGLRVVVAWMLTWILGLLGFGLLFSYLMF